MPEPLEPEEREKAEAAARLKAMRRERSRLVNKIRCQCLLSRGARAWARRSGQVARVLVWSKGRQ